ncbi:hypothetical protein EFY87_17935 [Flexivirga caeni]|uniref:Uncharacterized protein n=1 Tax=Flexivirga caeni TaxID=2294115 RepID=A0A3M9LYA0_9MICO|nr:hypothetical protein EFY87_17935 [Flexivirga caeni]
MTHVHLRHSAARFGADPLPQLRFGEPEVVHDTDRFLTERGTSVPNGVERSRISCGGSTPVDA